MDNPKIKPHQYSVVGLPSTLIEDRAKTLRWAYEYFDGDPSTLEDHQWSYMAEQSLLDNRSHMSVHKDFPVEVDWEYGVFGDYFIGDKWHKDYPLVYWTWCRPEAEGRMEHYAEQPKKFKNIKLMCRLVSKGMEVEQ